MANKQHLKHEEYHGVDLQESLAWAINQQIKAMGFIVFHSKDSPDDWKLKLDILIL